MGIRASFFLGSPDGLEGLFWQSGPHMFWDWAQYVEEEEPGHFPPKWLRRLERIVAEGPSSLSPEDRRDSEVIDALFDAFIGEYCDGLAGSVIKSASESVVRDGWYELARTGIESRCSRQTSLCWDHLLGGRAVGRPPSPYPYTPSDDVSRLGYGTAEEVRSVHDDLLANFPGVSRRSELRSQGRPLDTPEDEIAVVIAIEAAASAMDERTGLITTVA